MFSNGKSLLQQLHLEFPSLIVEAHYRMQFYMSTHSTKQRFSENGYLVCTLYVDNKRCHSIAIGFKEICCFSLDFVYIFLNFLQKVWILYHFVSILSRNLCENYESHI